MDLRNLILLSCQRAILGIIYTDIRAITIDYGKALFHWRVYFDGEPNHNETEALSVACTEILADLPYDVIGDPSFKCMKDFVFKRYEQPFR